MGPKRTRCARSGLGGSASAAADELLRVHPLDLAGELARDLRQLGEGPRDRAERDTLKRVPELAEVLANLLTNALRHTPAGGTVQASVGARVDRIEIVVADDGEGIGAEHLERVFERFYRVDPARARASGGTGIGLAIVRAIVEAHDGTVDASSDGAGRGAIFTVRLPISRWLAPDEGPGATASSVHQSR